MFSIVFFGQCATPPTSASCSGGNGRLPNNANITSGQVFWYDLSGSRSNINLNGGTLRICGNLTLGNLSFNSGTIIIEQGGALTLNGSNPFYMNGNSTVCNYGTLTVNKKNVLQNNHNLLINATSSAVLDMNNSSAYILEINSSHSFFVNNGLANISQIQINSNVSTSALCLGYGSCLNTARFTNSKTNAVFVDSGQASIYFLVGCKAALS